MEEAQVQSQSSSSLAVGNVSWEMRRARIASGLSLFANTFLLCSNFTVFWLTGSLSLLSTTVDSFLDLVSQLIIIAALRGNRNVNKDVWPLGRSRLEPVGLIVVSSLMGVASFQILAESIIRIVNGLSSSTPPQTPKFDTVSIVLASVAIGVKTVLFFICASVSKYSSTMAMLAEDHRNDVLSNSVALTAGLISNSVPSAWFVDPVGAILISIYICIRWILVGKQQAVMLVGRVASPEFLQRLKSIAESHDEGRMEIDVIRAYHFGHRFLVEVEVVVPPETGIIYAHDSALSLQKKIESVEEVERAHVHVDYLHRDEDEHKQTFHALDANNRMALHRRCISAMQSIIRRS